MVTKTGRPGPYGHRCRPSRPSKRCGSSSARACNGASFGPSVKGASGPTLRQVDVDLLRIVCSGPEARPQDVVFDCCSVLVKRGGEQLDDIEPRIWKVGEPHGSGLCLVCCIGRAPA
jgi:hypothetical protein